jgi:hypothetical protein
MLEKPILFCSSKAVPHMALLAHLYDLPLILGRKNKPGIAQLRGEQYIAATYFTEHMEIDQPIIGHLSDKNSRCYTDFIIANAVSMFNLINYSELINDDDFQSLQKHYEIIQLIIEPEYRKEIILNRLFRLYDHKQKNYVFIDQGLDDHRDAINETARIHTYMRAAGWDDPRDIRGFVALLLSADGHIHKSLMFEDAVKKRRPCINLSYANVFHDLADYHRLCDMLGQEARPQKWQEALASVALPQHIYWCGEYWDTKNI